MYARTYACMQVCMYLHIGMHACMCVCMLSVYENIHIHACVRTYSPCCIIFTFCTTFHWIHMPHLVFLGLEEVNPDTLAAEA